MVTRQELQNELRHFFDPKEWKTLPTRAANTIWWDRTSMKDRQPGITNAKDRKISALSRRDFLKLGGLGSLVIALAEAACARLQQPSPTATARESAAVTPSVVPEPTAARATATAPATPKKLEGEFYTEDPSFKLIEVRFDIYATKNEHQEWMGDNRAAFGFLIEGYPSSDGKPNSLFPYVVVDDGGQAKVFAWAGESDFAQLTRRVSDLTAESGRKIMVWETISSGVPVFMAEENLAGGYIIYILPNGEQVKIKLPALGGKLAKLALLAQPTPEPTATPDRAAELGIPVTENAYDEAVYAQLIDGRDVEGMISDRFKNFYSKLIPQDPVTQRFEVVGGVPLGVFEISKGEGNRLVCVLFALGEKGHQSVVNGTVYEGLRFVPVVVGAETDGQSYLMTGLNRFIGVEWKGEGVKPGYQYRWDDFNDLGDVVYFSQMPEEHRGEYWYTFYMIGTYYSEIGWELQDPTLDLSVPTRRNGAKVAVPGSYADPASGAPSFATATEVFDWAQSLGEPVITKSLNVNLEK